MSKFRGGGLTIFGKEVFFLVFACGDEFGFRVQDLVSWSGDDEILFPQA